MNAINNNTYTAFDVLHVNSKKVSCDGVKNASSHPLIFLDMGDNDFVVCPYCSRYFTTNQSYPNHQYNLKQKAKN